VSVSTSASPAPSPSSSKAVLPLPPSAAIRGPAQTLPPHQWGVSRGRECGPGSGSPLQPPGRLLRGSSSTAPLTQVELVVSINTVSGKIAASTITFNAIQNNTSHSPSSAAPIRQQRPHSTSASHASIRSVTWRRNIYPSSREVRAGSLFRQGPKRSDPMRNSDNHPLCSIPNANRSPRGTSPKIHQY
jgi:hypothetical protein